MSDKNLDTRRRVVEMLRKGWTRPRIAAATGLSPTRVTQLRQELAEKGDAVFLHPERGGRHATASALRAIIEGVLADEPWATGEWTLQELQDHLAGMGYPVSRHSIYAILYRLGYRTRWVRGPVVPKEVKTARKESA